jgi:hypothetical protein
MPMSDAFVSQMASTAGSLAMFPLVNVYGVFRTAAVVCQGS